MRVAFLVPPNAGLPLVWRVRAFVSAVCAQENGIELAVVGLPKGQFDWDKNADRLRSIDPRVEVRPTTWETVDSDTAARMHDLSAVAPHGVNKVQVPRDAGWSFRDCDAWIVFAHASLGAVADLKPSLVFCHDLSERYLPQLVALSRADSMWDLEVEGFLDWRGRRSVLTSTSAGLDDLSVFAGVRKANCSKIPSVWESFKLDALAAQKREPKYVVLLTGNNPRYDALLALNAYKRYFDAGGSLPLVVAGPNALELDPGRSNTLFAVELRLMKDEIVDRYSFANILDDEDLADVMSGAAAVWSNSQVDHEPDAMAIASQAGVPFVGVEQPSAKELAEVLGVGPFLYPNADARSAASAIFKALERAALGQRAVPKTSADAPAIAARRLGQTLTEHLHRVTR